MLKGIFNQKTITKIAKEDLNLNIMRNQREFTNNQINFHL